MSESEKTPKGGTTIAGVDDRTVDRGTDLDRAAAALAAASLSTTVGEIASLGISSRTDPLHIDVASAMRGMENLTEPLGTHKSASDAVTSAAAGLATAVEDFGLKGSAMDDAMKALAQVSGHHSLFGNSGGALSESMKAMASLTAISKIGRQSSTVGEAMKSLSNLANLSQASRHSSILESTMKSLGGATAFLRESPLSRALSTANILSRTGDRPLMGSVLDGLRKTQSMDGLANLSAHTNAMQAAHKALSLDLGGVGALARSRHWAHALSGYSTSEISKTLGAGSGIGIEVGRLQIAATGILGATELAGIRNLIEGARIGSAFRAELNETTLKMSLFASATDVLGPNAAGSSAAFTSLMGSYRSRLDFKPSFWRDADERTRIYRDADVDGGLIDADNAMTLEVLIESGVVEGQVGRNGSVAAVVEAGPIRMRITAGRMRVGAYQAIDAFEISLRAFVSAKLEAALGTDWFKHRVPGDIAKRAKERKREAMRNGEPGVHPIHFVDLGDLIPIITRKDNWGETFEAVFDRIDGLKIDLERLTAIRRPVMHARKVDSVQFCELVLTIKRLTRWMEMNGDWDRGWDADA